MSPARLQLTPSRTSHTGRARAAGVVLVGGVLLAAGCGEDLRTGPEKFHATLEPRNWADTLVLGDGRPVGVRVIDDKGREVLDAGVRWAVATPAVLGASAARATTTSATVDAHGGDSVQVDARQAGTTDVVVTLTDSRFYTTTLTRRATVVVAGVRASSARDTTITALGDTALVLGSGLAHAQGGAAGAALVPRASSGVVWTRLGGGAVALAGAGDSVRAVGQQGGTDTLVASHPYCLSGAHCADTVVVHVAQRGALGVSAPAFRAWSFGDSVVPSVLLQDARGHAIAGATLQIAPLTAADSAIVSVGAPPALAAALRASPAGAGPAFGTLHLSRASTFGAPAAAGSARAVARRPIVLTARGAAGTPRLSGASTAGLAAVAPIALTPLVAQGNGTASVAVRAIGPDRALLAADTITIVVRQIAAAVHVTPPQSLLTPGDSVPVRMEARDARGYLIADAAFVPTAAGVSVTAAGVVRVASGAAAGIGSVLAAVTGPANPATYTDAPIQAPARDTAWVRVQVPPATVAGDTTGTKLDAPVFSPDGKPVVGAWVRFVVPAGHVSPDSVQTGADGVAHANWTMPTKAGAYTATAVYLGTGPGGSGPATGAPSDSAGRIVLRRTLSVQAGALSALAVATAPPAAAVAGSVLTPAPSVQLVDAAGNAVRTAGVAVTVSLAAGAPGTLAGTLTRSTDANGVAQFGDLVLGGPVGARTLSFAASALAPLASNAIVLGAGAVAGTQTTVTLSAPTVASGSTVTVTVTPRDASGNPVGPGRTVAVAAGAAVGTAPGTPSTVQVSAVTDAGDGRYVATLTGVRSGAAVAIGATVDGLPAPNATLQVTPGAAVHVSRSGGDGQTAPVLTAVPVKPGAVVTDAQGNGVPGVVVTFAAAAGQGMLTGAAVTTNGLGVATLGGWTLGGTAGQQSITATAAGMQDRLVYTATATPGAPATVTMLRDSLLLTALGAGDTVSAVVKDAGGNVLTSPAVAWSVASAGTVTLGSTGTRPNGSQWVRITSAGNGLTQVLAAAGSVQGATKAAVRQNAATLTVTGPSNAIDIGDTTSLAITATDVNGNAVPRRFLTYASTNAGIVKVDTVGRLRGIGPGTATITVTNGSLSVTTSATTVTTTIAYHDFCTLDGLNVSGSTASVGCVMRLTGATASQAGGMWQPVAQKLDGGFESVMQFQITSPGGMSPAGADGLVMVIQSTSNTAAGQTGLGIGYQGLMKALAIELDTWKNTETNPQDGVSIGDPDNNHVAVQSCGPNAPATVTHQSVASGGCTFGIQTMPFNLKDGQVHTMRVKYVPGTLQVWFDNLTSPTVTAAIDLTNVKGGSLLDSQGKAWIGFTAGTGGAWENHDVLSWKLTPSP